VPILRDHLGSDITLTQLVLFSLYLLSPHPYNPLRSTQSQLIVPSHQVESPSNVSPPVFIDVPDDGPVDPEPSPASHPVIPVVQPPPKPERENATLLMLTNNWEMDGALRVVEQLEERFNREYKYPWIFLNDQPFSEEFERCAERAHAR
jgi:hypothetical protein